MIFVTKPFLPKLDIYQKYVAEIWAREYLTNNGVLVQELEAKLSEYLDTPKLLYTSNGTISLQIALNALDLKGSEVITTPFSYVATTSSLVWENCKPVFADICPDTFNISPTEIRKKITSETKAILATHVFGNPCDINEIEKIANEFNLHVIYDSAHAFGTEYNYQSIMKFGNVNSISFHATKLFHTIEGGAITCDSETLFESMKLKRNFGHSGFDVFDGVGINGKNSEFHAAMGLCNLPYVESILIDRKRIPEMYDRFLLDLPLKKQKILKETTKYNHAYYPVVFESEEILLNVKAHLEKNNIFPRRYFYPSLNKLNYIDYTECMNSESISSRIMCLPVFYNLEKTEIELICNHIRDCFN